MNQDNIRPWTVVLACVTSLAISAWDIVSAVGDDELLAPPGFVTLYIFMSLIPFGLTVASFLRRNWGRIALAAMTALGALSFPLLLLFQRDLIVDTTASLVEGALYGLAEAVVAVLLFLPASNAWYRAAHAETA